MAVIEGVDCSYDPPTPAELKAAGKAFVVRYVSTPGHAKNLKPAERAGYQAAGIAICIIGQISKDRALGGYAQGQADMRSFRQQVVDVGGPAQGVIRMAVDFDVLGFDATPARSVAARELAVRLQDLPEPAREGDPHALAALGPEGEKVGALRASLRAAQMPTVIDYVRGGASVNGMGWTGPYGEHDVMAAWAALGGGYCWQTYAWSGGRWHPAAILQQYRNNVALGSGLVDLDRALAADYGQWGAQAGAGWWTRPLGDAERAQLRDAFLKVLQ